MKRVDLLRHLERHDCALVREGRRHSWWRCEVNGKRAAIPSHREIPKLLLVTASSGLSEVWDWITQDGGGGSDDGSSDDAPYDRP